MPKESEEKAKLAVLANGCVAKIDLRRLFFMDSRRHFSATIRLLKDKSQEFTDAYKPYERKNTIPKSVAIALLRHNEFFENEDYIFTNFLKS